MDEATGSPSDEDIASARQMPVADDPAPEGAGACPRADRPGMG
jgi:hypothetical protein